MSEIQAVANDNHVDSVGCKVRIKLAGVGQPLVLVPTFVNGEGPYDFILDTGAGTCLIEPRLADRLRIFPDHTRVGMGAAGPVTIGLGNANSVSVGRANVSDLEVGITDEVQKIAAVVGTPIHGALGFPFLRKLRLVLDYKAQTLNLGESGDDASDTEIVEARLNFRLAAIQKPLILIPVWLNERGPYQFALDTGTSTTVISSDTASELYIPGSAIPNVTAGGGSLFASTGKLKSIAVGDVLVNDLAVVILDALKSLSQAVGQRLDGILGHNFLRDFILTVDYPRELLMLRHPRA